MRHDRILSPKTVALALAESGKSRRGRQFLLAIIPARFDWFNRQLAKADAAGFPGFAGSPPWVSSWMFGHSTTAQALTN